MLGPRSSLPAHGLFDRIAATSDHALTKNNQHLIVEGFLNLHQFAHSRRLHKLRDQPKRPQLLELDRAILVEQVLKDLARSTEAPFRAAWNMDDHVGPCGIGDRSPILRVIGHPNDGCVVVFVWLWFRCAVTSSGC